MADDWIKMRVSLDTHPKVIALAQELGVPELHIVGLLWKVWSWADTHSVDGNAVDVTTVTLDRFAGVSGFAAALRNIGWLEGRDRALTFPRFDQHNGQTAKKRAQGTKRVQKHRNASVTHEALPEKRREEKSNTPLPPRGADDLVFPVGADCLDTPAFRSKWGEWLAHLTEMRAGTMTSMTERTLLQKLARAGHDRAIAAIDQSIECGWKSVDPARLNRPGKSDQADSDPGGAPVKVGISE